MKVSVARVLKGIQLSQTVVFLLGKYVRARSMAYINLAFINKCMGCSKGTKVHYLMYVYGFTCSPIVLLWISLVAAAFMRFAIYCARVVDFFKLMTIDNQLGLVCKAYHRSVNSIVNIWPLVRDFLFIYQIRYYLLVFYRMGITCF